MSIAIALAYRGGTNGLKRGHGPRASHQHRLSRRLDFPLESRRRAPGPKLAGGANFAKFRPRAIGSGAALGAWAKRLRGACSKSYVRLPDASCLRLSRSCLRLPPMPDDDFPLDRQLHPECRLQGRRYRSRDGEGQDFAAGDRLQYRRLHHPRYQAERRQYLCSCRMQVPQRATDGRHHLHAASRQHDRVCRSRHDV